MFLLIFRYIKKCYKRSIVIVFCFFLSFMTIWTNGILKQTANRVELNSLKKDSIYHLKFNNLSSDGVRYLKNHQRVESVHIENLVDASDTSGDYLINVLSKEKSLYSLKRGNYPKNNRQVMVQEWLIKNLGKKLGDKIEFKSDITRDIKSYEIVGVLHDREYDKYKAKFELFTVNYNNQLNTYNRVNLILKDSSQIREDANNIVYELKKKNLVKSTEDSINNMLIDAYENDGNTGSEVLKIMLISIIFTSVIIGSTYLISIRTRVEDIGIFRALGMRFIEIFILILGELYTLMLIGSVFAFPGSVLAARYIVKEGRNFYSEVQASADIFDGLVINYKIMLVGLLSMMVFVILIGLFVCYLSVKGEPIDTIKTRRKIRHLKSNRKIWTWLGNKFEVGIFVFLKYLRLDYVLTLVLIVAVALPISELLMRSYYVRENQRVMSLVGDFTYADFQISNNNSMDLESYVPMDSIERIEDVKDRYGDRMISKSMWASYKFSNFDIPKDKMNRKDYFDDYSNQPYMKKVLEGIYRENKNSYTIKNMVIGYNDEAINELKDHIYEGKKDSINPSSISEDECILYYPVNYVDLNGEKNPRNKILNYHVGDKIDVNIAVDLHNTKQDPDKILGFWRLRGGVNTVRKTYKIVAIVDYLPIKMNYGQDGSVNVIVPHKNMKSIDKYIEYSAGELYLKNIKYEKEVEKIVLENLKMIPGYLLSNMAKERRAQFENTNSYISIENIKYYAFIVVAIACMINLLTYKTISKRKDIGIMMTLGMNDIDIKIMLMGEAILYAVFSATLSLIIILIRQLEHIREMEKLSKIIGLNIDINPLIFLVIFAISLFVCIASTYIPGNKIINDDIGQVIKDFE